MCICVCVYIYVYREHAKRRNRFISRFPFFPPSFFFSRSAKREFYNHASLCTSLIRFIFIGYRFPASPLRHFYAIREIRVRETTRSSRDISLYDKYSSLSLTFDRERRDEDTGFHRFSPPLSPMDRSIEDARKAVSAKIQYHLSVSLSRSSWVIWEKKLVLRSSPIHARWRGLESFGSEKDLRRERNAKERKRERREESEGRVREARFPREVIKIFTSRFRCERPREEEGNGDGVIDGGPELNK